MDDARIVYRLSSTVRPVYFWCRFVMEGSWRLMDSRGI